MKILKFGGSSLATPDCIFRVTEIVRAAASDGRVAVVVSAFGGATDSLGEAAEKSRKRLEDVEDLVAALEQRHLEAARTVANPREHQELETRVRTILAELLDLLRGVGLVGEVSPRSLDHILACGELLAAPIVAAALRKVDLEVADLDARRLIVTDATYGDARPDVHETGVRIRDHFDRASAIQVITGFVGATVDGETTTLGRGGSDFTAAIVAAALDASALELWTDVDGVMSADPRLVPGAQPIARMRYEELMELSHFGAEVVHPPSVHPVRAHDIPLWIKNTFRPERPGTLVSTPVTNEEHGNAAGGRPIRAITSIHRVAMGRLEGDGMVGVPGVAMRLFGALARCNVSVILITQASSEHTICFAVAPEDLEAARQAIEAEFEMDRRAGDIDELSIEDDLAVVAAVGSAMCQLPGIAGRLFSVLGERGINVRAIAQGSSELNISLVVRREDEARAVNAIHGAFFAREPPTASLYLAGIGGVGEALLEQLANRQARPESTTGCRLCLRGVADSKGALVDPSGLDPRTAVGRLLSERRANRQDLLIAAIEEDSGERRSSPRIFVDCTASETMAGVYERLLAEGVAVVTANKKPLAGELAQYRRLGGRYGGKLFYETTVGAGLPVVRTLADLLATGDELVRLEGVLSGTASFLTGELARGELFSRALARARDLGYLEPDPRDDLAGEDVARKLLILARLAGAALERRNLEIHPLVPAAPWLEMELEEFWRRLPELDEELGRRRQAASKSGSRLTYLASWDGREARVALTEVAPGHPCFDLAPGENLVAFYTRRYARIPLVVRGPGAGPEVTAAGVLTDILNAVAQWENRK